MYALIYEGNSSVLAESAYITGGQEVVGSNPAIPINFWLELPFRPYLIRAFT